MKLYQLHHDNIEPDENFIGFREGVVYTDRDCLIKCIKSYGYVEEPFFGKNTFVLRTLDSHVVNWLTIHEVEVINNKED